MLGPAWLGLRTLRRRPPRTALTVAGIAIGVALVFAALSVDAAASSGAAGYAAQLDGRADLAVQAFGEGTLSQATVATIDATSGVLATSPQVRRPSFAWASPGAGPGSSPGTGATAPAGSLAGIGSVGSSGLGAAAAGGAPAASGAAALAPVATRSLGAVTVVGVDPNAYRALHDESLASGQALSSSDGAGVVLAEPWAGAHGLAVGSRIALMGGGGERTYVVRGILAASGPALADGGDLAWMTIASARALFALPAGSADLVELRVDPAVGVPAVESRLEARLSTQPYLLSTSADEAAALAGASSSLGTGLLLVAAVVLFVGALLVSDALAMSVTERTREVGLLRAAGATRRQVHAMVLAEALGLGAAGSVLGLVVGALVAAVLVPVVGSVTGAPVSGTPIDPGSLAVAVLLGLLVTVVAALGPAWRAGRVAPVEALRAPTRSAPPAGLDRSAVGGAAASVAGTAVLVLGGAVTASSAQGGIAGTAGPLGALVEAVAAALAILVLVVAAGLVAPPVLRLSGAIVGAVATPLRRSLGAEVRIARRSVAHDPWRVSVAFTALATGLALFVALSGVADGMRRAGEAWIADVAPADYAVVAVSPVPDSFGTELSAVPGVRSVTPVRLFDVAIAGRRASAVAVDPGAYGGLGALTVVGGGSRTAALASLQAGGAALVPQAIADRFGLRVGDSLGLRTASGSVTLRVAAIVAHSLPGASGESVVVSQSDAARSLGITGASMFLVRADNPADAALGTALSRVAGQYALSVVRPAAIGGAVGGALDRTFGLLDVLALAGVVVAALSMLDVLLMDVRQRVGELGLLRAAGLTRAQAWRAVVVEAGILGLASALVGSVAGTAGSALVLAAGSGAPGFALGVPWPAIGLALVLGIAGTVIAATYPARLAARIDIPRALRAE